MDFILRHANLPDGRSNIDIGILGDRIVALEQGLAATGATEMDALGRLVSPPFVDAHFHLDAALSLGLPRINRSGTLLEGISLWSELKPQLTTDAVIKRALAYCDMAVAQGLLAIRSHVDVCDDRLLAVEALLEVKRKVASYLDLQLVAFPQDGLFRSPNAEHSRHIETLAAETYRLGLQGRVAGSHLTSMHSMDNYYVSKLLPLIAEAEIAAIANPLINITLQGRHDSYPKRRGLTRVPELIAAGVTVAFGHDCVMDPWYSFGSADMLEVAHVGLHIAQMTSREALQSCYDAVTVRPARILGLEHYGIEPGCYADLVLLQASDPFEAIRLKATRLLVMRRGKIVAQTSEKWTALNVPGRPERVELNFVPGSIQ